MAIAYSSQGAGVATEASGGALSPLCPAVVAANDILIAHCCYEGTTTTPDTPGGWTPLGGPYTIETAYRHWIFGKLAAGTEDGAAVAFGTPAVTTVRWARVYSFTGWVSGAIADNVPAASFAHLSHATDPQMPTVTTTVAGALAVACVAQADDNPLASATGESGGDWVEAVAEYVQAATTPDTGMGIQTCTPTGDPGTVTGGTIATLNDPCGVIGFEIRPSIPAVTGTGVLASQAADVTGSGLSVSSSTDGAIAAQAATAAGSGLSTSLGTGALTAQAAAVAGSGTVETPAITGTGALAAQAASVSGAGVSLSAGTGVLVAQASAISGAGVSLSTGTGAPQAQAADVTGAGLSLSTGAGVLSSQAASVAGTGEAEVASITGTGVLTAQAASVTGDGLSASTGTGALLAAAADVTGAGVSASVGSGALVAQAAANDGVGISASLGTGALASQAASVDGTGQALDAGAVTGTGALQAGLSLVAGTGTVSGAVAAQPGGSGGRVRRRMPIFAPPEYRMPVISGTGNLHAGSANVIGIGTVEDSARQIRNRRTLAMLLAA